MEIKILFDKKTADSKLNIGWGFSVLIDNKLLFDTGEKGEYLIKNMEQLHILPESIESVVVSHDHWDHTGGLWDFLDNVKGRDIPVYVCPGFSNDTFEKIKSLGGKTIQVGAVHQIAENIFTTGEIIGEYKGKPMPEQSIIIKTDKGISIITGCAHYGILNVVEKTREHFDTKSIYLVMGGFHLSGKDIREIQFLAEEFKSMGVRNVAPTHCSGDKAEEVFFKEYKENFIGIEVGKVVKL
jgi:7,8-dihydropterin-6-yl-methyl-4-(beta-D-ribofuranosyl)aminobenzene 5'-phosphate synthase